MITKGSFFVLLAILISKINKMFIGLPIGMSPHSVATRCFQESTVAKESTSEQLKMLSKGYASELSVGGQFVKEHSLIKFLFYLISLVK